MISLISCSRSITPFRQLFIYKPCYSLTYLYPGRLELGLLLPDGVRLMLQLPDLLANLDLCLGKFFLVIQYLQIYKIYRWIKCNIWLYYSLDNFKNDLNQSILNQQKIKSMQTTREPENGPFHIKPATREKLEVNLSDFLEIVCA